MVVGTLGPIIIKGEVTVVGSLSPICIEKII